MTRSTWTPRVLLGGGLLFALIVASVMGYGSAVPQTCYTSCSITVSAQSSTTTTTVGTSVSFSVTASGGTPPYTYAWVFGDGGTSNLQDPTHSYTATSPSNGYNVQVTVTDTSGDHASSNTIVMTVTSSSGSTSGSSTSALSAGDLAAIIAAIVIILIAVIAVVLLMRKRKQGQVAAAAGAGYVAEPAPYAGGAVDPSSLEPPAPGVPPPPNSDNQMPH